MNNFFKDNIVSIIGLAITCGGLLVHVGVTKAELATLKTEVARIQSHGTIVAQQNQARIEVIAKELIEHKTDVKEKIREMESTNARALEKINETLNKLDKQVAIIVNHIEKQERAVTRAENRADNRNP